MYDDDGEKTDDNVNENNIENEDIENEDIDKDDEVIALELTGKCARQTYEIALKEKKVDFCIPLLRAMAIGELSDDDVQLATMNEYVKKGWLLKTQIKVSNQILKDELMRRHSIDEEINDDGERKKRPILSGTQIALTDRLASVSDDDKQTFPLKYKTERKWVKMKIGSVLVSIKIEKRKEEEKKMKNGDHLKNETHLKMRLIHGEYYLAFHACIHIT